jgi:hypothetical protein
VCDVVRSLDPDLPVFRVQTLDHAIAASFTRQRVLGPMFTIFGLAALLRTTRSSSAEWPGRSRSWACSPV